MSYAGGVVTDGPALTELLQISSQRMFDFIDHVIPELQKRGLAQREYAPGTLRQRLFEGRPARLIDRHPAAKYRGAFTRPPGEAGGDTDTAVRWLAAE